MSNSQSYETRFNNWLDPFKVMLSSKKQLLSQEEWLNLVERIKNSIILNPDQYLGKDLPDREIIELAVTNIFNEFLQREGHGKE